MSSFMPSWLECQEDFPVVLVQKMILHIIIAKVGFDHRVGHLWLVATQHDGGTFVHFFFRSLHDCRKIPTYFAGLSQMARGYINYSLSW